MRGWFVGDDKGVKPHHGIGGDSFADEPLVGYWCNVRVMVGDHERLPHITIVGWGTVRSPAHAESSRVGKRSAPRSSPCHPPPTAALLTGVRDEEVHGLKVGKRKVIPFVIYVLFNQLLRCVLLQRTEF